MFGSQSHFKRYEKKYIISSAMAELLRGQIGFYVPRDVKAMKSPIISSIYFDNIDWKCYRAQLNKVNPRFKIRFRQYTNGEFKSKDGFLEIKRKADSVSLKERIKVNKGMLDAVTDEYMPDEIRECNKGLEIEKLNAIYFNLAGEINKLGLEPVAKVSYVRQAFESQDRSLRVTFDSSLEFMSIPNDFSYAANPYTKFSDMFVIMEVKYADKMPEWLMSLLRNSNIRTQKFSKYCHAITSLYEPEEEQQENYKIITRGNKKFKYGNVEELIFS